MVGALHAITKQIVTSYNETYVNAQVIARFLRKLQAEFSDLPLVIVLDNARYQHCLFIKDLAHELGIDYYFCHPTLPILILLNDCGK